MQFEIRAGLDNLESTFSHVQDLYNFTNNRIERISRPMSGVSTSTMLTARIKLAAWLERREGTWQLSSRSTSTTMRLQQRDSVFTSPSPSQPLVPDVRTNTHRPDSPVRLAPPANQARRPPAPPHTQAQPSSQPPVLRRETPSLPPPQAASMPVFIRSNSLAGLGPSPGQVHSRGFASTDALLNGSNNRNGSSSSLLDGSNNHNSSSSSNVSTSEPTSTRSNSPADLGLSPGQMHSRGFASTDALLDGSNNRNSSSSSNVNTSVPTATGPKVSFNVPHGPEQDPHSVAPVTQKCWYRRTTNLDDIMPDPFGFTDVEDTSVPTPTGRNMWFNVPHEPGQDLLLQPNRRATNLDDIIPDTFGFTDVEDTSVPHGPGQDPPSTAAAPRGRPTNPDDNMFVDPFGFTVVEDTWYDGGCWVSICLHIFLL